ncbi:hypothetical protein Tco_1393784 [Tanacetum coccineum]
MEERRINGNELKTELKEIRTQIIKLQKKRPGSTRCCHGKCLVILLELSVVITGNSKSLSAESTFCFNGTEVQ